MPNADRLEAFYKCWTRKESVVKSIRKGLSFLINHFTVTFGPKQPAKIVDLQLARSIMFDCKLYAIDTIPGYQAAVTLIGPNLDFNLTRFTY